MEFINFRRNNIVLERFEEEGLNWESVNWDVGGSGVVPLGFVDVKRHAIDDSGRVPRAEYDRTKAQTWFSGIFRPSTDFI